jgi:beta-glucosidase
VDITNSGNRDGEEIVQLYIRDLVGDVTRPVKELKGFKKVPVKKGETVTVTFSITSEDLSYYHQNMSFTYDPGEFLLYIGSSSAEERSVKLTVQ